MDTGRVSGWGWSPTRRQGRRSKESQVGQESLETFSQADFDERLFVAQFLRVAEPDWRGHQGRAGHGDRWFPPCSQSVALAARMGFDGKELPPGLAGIRRWRLRRAGASTRKTPGSER